MSKTSFTTSEYCTGIADDYITEYNHPSHYNTGKIEVVDYIDDQGLNFNLGNAIKYISRCNHKGSKKTDLKKAIWYIQREIDNMEE